MTTFDGIWYSQSCLLSVALVVWLDVLVIDSMYDLYEGNQQMYCQTSLYQLEPKTRAY
jgi:hypothetical protein